MQEIILGRVILRLAKSSSNIICLYADRGVILRVEKSSPRSADLLLFRFVVFTFLHHQILYIHMIWHDMSMQLDESMKLVANILKIVRHLVERKRDA